MYVFGFFSGIGGFELGFECAGHEVVSVCEIDPFCNKVLLKHWPKVPNLGNIQSLSAASLVRIFQLQESKKGGKGIEVVSIKIISLLSLRKGLRGLSQKMLDTRGEGGCLTCGAHYTASGMPLCRYKCAPLTWGRRTKEIGSFLLPMPTASSYGSSRGGGSGRVGKWRMSLHQMAAKNLWPTPRSSEAGREPSRVKDRGSRSTLSEKLGGKLNPVWIEWLMGFPAGWTELRPLEMQSFRKSRKSLLPGLDS